MTDLLDAFDKKCRENNLKYSLCGGTLIGALRHKGFIPWDDDIDVMMLRPDYEKFIHLTFDEPYLLEAPEILSKEKRYIYCYAKLYNTKTIMIEDPQAKQYKTHVYIDIWPMDVIPENKDEFKKDMIRARKYTNYNYMLESADMLKNRKDASLLYRAKWSLISVARAVLPARYFYYKALKVAKSHQNEDTGYVGHPLSETNPEYHYKKENMIMDFHVPFEGKEYMSVHDPDYFMSVHYGDYMQLPPVEEQKTHHDNICYWAD